jgi:Zn-dependent M28 family amino/carboxypeptidase
MRRSLFIAFLLIAAGTVAASAPAGGFQEAWESITAAEIRAHLFLLSSDRLEGRQPGTRGADIAAEYIAGRFISYGLEPVAGTYFQGVPLTGITTDPTTVSLAFEGDDARLPAVHPDDAVIWPGAPLPSVQVSGELLFVGYGVHAPEWGWNDYKGRDVHGRVLLILAGDPPSPPDDPGRFDGRALTYYGRWSYKLEEARRRGAIGALIIHRPESAGYDWGVVSSSWTGEQLSLEEEAGTGTPVLLQGWLTTDFARRALALADLDLDELAVRAARADFSPVSTGMTVRSRMNSRSRAVRAQNVVGYLPGRTDEIVVFTAHYDHLGIGPAVDGDSIYNGAYDNASGVSALLEVADAFARLDPAGRGVLFVATTAEEAGLLGARHYINQPLFPLEATIAVVNIDGVSIWGETHDVIAPGVHRSTLARNVGARAAEMGMRVRPDPAPERGGFFRSDHFPFARAGIPALYLQHGLDFRGRPAGWGDDLMARWLRENYHQPSDELGADPDLSGAVQQARLAFAVGFDLVTASEAPAWLDGTPPSFGPPHPTPRR